MFGTPQGTSQKNKAVFVDRDGVINEERGYVYRIEDFQVLPGVVTALSQLQSQGWRLVVVTNQAGIARGLYDEADYQRLETHMRTWFRERGVVFDAIYHCPHHPDAARAHLRLECPCRKPRPGMLLDAAARLDLSLDRSVIVGDKLSDLQAGRAAGLAAGVLVESGHSPDADARALADHICPGLLQAAAWISGRTW